MNNYFDRICRILATPMPRSRALKLIFGGLLGALFSKRASAASSGNIGYGYQDQRGHYDSKGRPDPKGKYDAWGERWENDDERYHFDEHGRYDSRGGHFDKHGNCDPRFNNGCRPGWDYCPGDDQGCCPPGQKCCGTGWRSFCCADTHSCCDDECCPPPKECVNGRCQKKEISPVKPRW